MGREHVSTSLPPWSARMLQHAKAISPLELLMRWAGEPLGRAAVQMAGEGWWHVEDRLGEFHSIIHYWAGCGRGVYIWVGYGEEVARVH